MQSVHKAPISMNDAKTARADFHTFARSGHRLLERCWLALLVWLCSATKMNDIEGVLHSEKGAFARLQVVQRASLVQQQ